MGSRQPSRARASPVTGASRRPGATGCRRSSRESSFYPPIVTCAAGLLYLALPVVPLTAQAVIWAFLVVGTLAVFGVGRRLLDADAGLLAAFLFATAPFVVFMLLNFQLDLPAGRHGGAGPLHAGANGGSVGPPVGARAAASCSAWACSPSRRSPPICRGRSSGSPGGRSGRPIAGPACSICSPRWGWRRRSRCRGTGRAWSGCRRRSSIARSSRRPNRGTRRRSAAPRCCSIPSGSSRSGVSWPTALLLWGIVALARRPRARGLLWAALAPFLIFVLIQNKNLRYTLPFLPAAALVAAAGVSVLPPRARRGDRLGVRDRRGRAGGLGRLRAPAAHAAGAGRLLGRVLLAARSGETGITARSSTPSSARRGPAGRGWRWCPTTTTSRSPTSATRWRAIGCRSA